MKLSHLSRPPPYICVIHQCHMLVKPQGSEADCFRMCYDPTNFLTYVILTYDTPLMTHFLTDMSPFYFS